MEEFYATHQTIEEWTDHHENANHKYVLYTDASVKPNLILIYSQFCIKLSERGSVHEVLTIS